MQSCNRAIKAPDYSFRLSGGKRLFFVEAKKPGVYVKEDIQPAYPELVDAILNLNIDKRKAKLATSLDQIQEKIEYYESRINSLVYQLYSLSEEEIRIVEESAK